MRWLTLVWQNLRHRRRIEQDLDEEIRGTREMLVDEKMRAGLTPAAALRATTIEWGGVEQLKEQVRERRPGTLLESFLRDLRYALTALRRRPGFAVAAILVLAAGVGANNALFILLNAACLRGLPIADADRVLDISTRDAQGHEAAVSYLDFLDMRTDAGAAIAHLAAYGTAPVAVSDAERAPERAVAAYVSANLFALLRERPLLGRDFQIEDDRPGAPAVAILNGHLWRARYAADPSIVGRTIRVDGAPVAVIGVMPDRVRMPNDADVWLPLARMPGVAAAPRGARSLTVLGRLADARTLGDADAALSAAAARLSAAYPETNRDVRVFIQPINRRYMQRITDPNWISFILVGVMVVLISCGNVANLLLVRAAERSREIAMRVSLGATRQRVIRQLLVESTVLATLGGIGGLIASVAGVRALRAAIPANSLPFWFDISLDARIIAVLITVCACTIFVFGLLPAIHISKTELINVLKDGGRTATSGPRTRRWTTMFLAAQLALTCVFLASAVTSLRQSRAVRQAEFRADYSHIVTAWLNLPPQRYATQADRIRFLRSLNERLDATSVIASHATAASLPFGAMPSRRIVVDGTAPAAGDTARLVRTVAVGAGYFQTLGLAVAGREFNAADGSAGHESAVVNQRVADLYFAGASPIGRLIQLSADNAPTASATIVGVVPNVRYRDDNLIEPDPMVYLPFEANGPSTIALVLRTSDMSSALAAAREEVRRLDPDLPIYRAMTMERALLDANWGGRLSWVISIVLVCLAFCLSMVGLQAVTSHGVAQRTQELAVRIALGARARQVVGLVLRRTVRQIGYGLAAGAFLTWGWQRLFASLAPAPAGSTPGLAVADPLTLALVAVLIVGVALAACALPARRALNVDPLAALRRD